MELTPGYHELRVRSGLSVATYHAMIAPGANRAVARAGNGWMYGSSLILYVTGFIAIPIGAVFTAVGYAVDDMKQFRGAGLGLLAGGAGAVVLAIPLGIWGSAELGAAPSPRGALGSVPAIRLKGTF